ncbi:uncharacterized protein LOC114307674 [Camellia sinensis]|uniref:uncharacterized protein LOC114307674 n=1 Tax=Camellia sinensis TaxID=4442 RepID=UPI0010368176|nr:uncharacterized protein LOC114307674 [Camellia sinensis]
MDQPLGFVDPSKRTMVCKLHKALYGLKQAPRTWFSTFSRFLLSQGFLQSKCDSSLFVRKTTSSITYLLIYVDDILLIGTNEEFIQTLLIHMHKAFSMKELCHISYFLSILVQSSPHGYFPSQSKYATDIFAKAGMKDCKPCATLVFLKPPLLPHASLLFSQPFLYRSIVGALQYLTITRHELSYVVNFACQYMHSPTNCHFAAVKRILRYVQGILSHGLHFQPSNFHLQAYSDSNWAGDLSDHKSTSGYCVYLGANLISWSSMKQSTVSRSSTEAEYRYLAHTTAKLTWLQMLLAEFAIPQPSLPVLWCDNLSSLSLATNPVFHNRSKHIEVTAILFARRLPLASCCSSMF